MTEEKINETGLIKLLEQVDWQKLPPKQQDLGVRYLHDYFRLDYQPKREDVYYFGTIENDMQKIREANPYTTFGAMTNKILDILDLYKLSNEETQTTMPVVSEDEWQEYAR